jgi:hypothetical protein
MYSAVNLGKFRTPFRNEAFLNLIWIELDGIWVRALPDPMHLGLRTGPLCPMFCSKLEKPRSFRKVPDGPYTKFPDIRVHKEETQMCMSEWSQDLTLTQHVDWGFFVSRPHFLQVGLLLSPITYKCLLRVLCPVRTPIITLDCVLLKDNNRALVVG